MEKAELIARITNSIMFGFIIASLFSLRWDARELTSNIKKLIKKLEEKQNERKNND